METIESRIAEKDRAIELCEGRSLLDSAFVVLRYKLEVASWGGEPYATPLYLSDVFPKAGRKERQVAEIKARQLWVSALDYSTWQMQQSNGIDIFQHMAAAHPGFSKDCYETVIHRAQYIAIK